MRSMHSSERIEEMMCELQGHTWDAVLLNETLESCQVRNLGNTSQTYVHEGAGKYDHKHGVGILLNKGGDKKSLILRRTGHHNNDFGQPTTHQADEQKLSPLRVDHHVEKMHRTIEKHTNSGKKCVQIGGDFNAELGPRYGVQRAGVGPHTLNGGNKKKTG